MLYHQSTGLELKRPELRGNLLVLCHQNIGLEAKRPQLREQHVDISAGTKKQTLQEQVGMRRRIRKQINNRR